MELHIPGDHQRRQRERQRMDLLQWVVTVSAQPGIKTGQIVSTAFIQDCLRPAQSSLQAVLDEPGGERIVLSVHPNGSILMELAFDALVGLDELTLSQCTAELQKLISDLFHSDELEFNHALVSIGHELVLRTISSIGPERSLTGLVAEMLALQEILLIEMASYLGEVTWRPEEQFTQAVEGRVEGEPDAG